MMPDKNTIFLTLSEIEKYLDKENFFCMGIVFSPETENNHFHGCPPYIKICDSENYYFFEVPEIIAFYAKEHVGYTMEGLKSRIKEGKRELANEIRSLLFIK